MGLVGNRLEIFWFMTMVVVPVLTVWGWIRWTSNARVRTFPSTASFIAFCFSTASVVLAFSTWLVAIFKGFAYYDPVLMVIYGIGLVLSLAAFLFSLVGLWRPNLLRWHAPLCAMGTFFFWLMQAASE